MNDTEASRAYPDGGGSEPPAAPNQAPPDPHPDLQKAIDAANAKNNALAEELTRYFLSTHPADPSALKLLGDLLMQKNTFLGAQAAEGLFAKCLELRPGFIDARHSYAKLLLKMAKLGPAKAQIEMLLQSDPKNVSFRTLMAYVQGQTGAYDSALKYHEELLATTPPTRAALMVYANDLRAAGRTKDCIAMYRRVLEMDPEFSPAYSALCDLKTFRFTPEEADHIQAQLVRKDLSVDSRVHLNFALGKYFEDLGKYKHAFGHFQTANELQRSTLPYDSDRTIKEFSLLKAIFTPTFFAERAGAGCEAADPIFIVGLPRSGSTLVEQILASHSAVEGTRELPGMQTMVAQLQGEFNKGLTGLTGETLRRLG
ncbi:MAG TPA: sulfotransferase, partial [Rhizomicrobium sp.]|nr:sulfotransferase [Rhizomicrobium sp.]